DLLEEVDSDQEMVINMLKENEGRMLQKDIVDKSDYSKAKISGVVKELEEKDIISKEKEGRSNKVVLKDKFNS
ncbi:MAG: MarR family transcriptional regulator, partial [Candidatus Paceibacterota bacterium]